MARKQKSEKEVSWYRADLPYELLNAIKERVTDYGASDDVVGMYNALESEFAMIWEYVRDYSIADEDKDYYRQLFGEVKFDMFFWENKFQIVRNLLYDPRLDKGTPASEKRRIINYGQAKRILHILNMMLTKYEVQAHLLIPRANIKDPNKAFASYGG